MSTTNNKNTTRMYENQAVESSKLTIRDLVTTGIFGALIFITAGVGGTVFAVTPTLTFYFPLGAALLPGPIYLLYLSKVGKRGGLTIIGIVIGVLCLITGMHWALTIGSIVCSLLAELVAGSGRYKNRVRNMISYIIYTYWATGSYIVFFIDPEGWAKIMLGNGTTQDYIDTMREAASGTVFFIMIVGVAAVATISALIGNRLLKKQFEKAGII